SVGLQYQRCQPLSGHCARGESAGLDRGLPKPVPIRDHAPVLFRDTQHQHPHQPGPSSGRVPRRIQRLPRRGEASRRLPGSGAQGRKDEHQVHPRFRRNDRQLHNNGEDSIVQRNEKRRTIGQ
ncbi:unnamed protein product, partial [Ixodes persulcatus]